MGQRLSGSQTEVSVKSHDSRFGAVLVPIGVAVLLLGGLAWYEFARVPAQEAYLNERNLRLLSTISGAIKAKIESFDGALDHAVTSFRPAKDKDAVDTFARGVRLFAPDLEVLALDPSPTKPRADDPNTPEVRLLNAAADPPRVLVERDEERYYLYLGARLEIADDTPLHGTSVIKVFARSDLDAVLKPLLDGNSEFADILVTTDAGDVIAQDSSVGLSLARIDDAIALRSRGAAVKDAPQPPAFAMLSSFSNMVPATIGQVGYKLYMQPISLSLLSVKTPDGARQAERWVLCGLVREDRFTAESAAVSYPWLLWFSGILAALTLSLPFVKLHAISGQERWRASDARWITVAAFVGAGLLTLGALDIWAFYVSFGSAVNRRLQAVAQQIGDRVDREATRIDAQGNAFDAALGQDFTEVVAELRDSDQDIPTINVDRKGHASCIPTPACKTYLLSSQPQEIRDYPFFDLVTWAGTDGWQRVRWTPGKNIRPFVNVLEEKLPYAARAQAAWNAPDAPEVKGMTVLTSPTTGEPLTASWRTGRSQKRRPDGEETRPQQWVRSLAMATFVSLDRPILPKGVSYAVVDRDGLVLFHSVPNRRLRENFLKECEDDGHLRALLQEGRTDQIVVPYRGRNIRLSVSPLAFHAFTHDDDPHWRLLTFQDAAIVDTVNLETVTVASLLFGFYGVLLAIVGAMMIRAGVQRRNWFWPEPGKRAAYRTAALVNVAAIAWFAAIFRIGTALDRPDAILIASIVMAIAALVSAYWIVSRSPAADASDTFGWRHPFYLARAALLMVVAVLPAAACFHAAYTFETTLLAKSELTQLNTDKANLDARANKTVAQFGRPAAQRLYDFVSDATYAPLWDEQYVPRERARGLQTFNGMLLPMHRRYNEIAVAFESSIQDIGNDLASGPGEAAMPAPAPPPEPDVVRLLVAIGIVLVCCYAIVYVLVRPMFALEALAAPRTPSAVPWTGFRLIVGPPGSNKSKTLARHPQLRVFDIATRAWIERRKTIVDVKHERRRFLGVAVGESTYRWGPTYLREAILDEAFASAETTPPAPAASGAGAWADAFDYAELPRAMAIDHIDYRLDDDNRDFASQTLMFVERAVYRENCTVQIVGDRDPLACVRESKATPAEIARWLRVLRPFRKDVVAVGDSSSGTLQPDSVSGAPYYEALWNACSPDERLALRHIADEQVVNPQSRAVVQHLVQTGLVVRQSGARIADPAFREFVQRAASDDQIREWELRGVTVPWGSIELAFVTGIVALAGLLVITQQQLLNAWMGVLPALLPVAKPTVETVAKLFAVFRPSQKSVTATV